MRLGCWRKEREKTRKDKKRKREKEKIARSSKSRGLFVRRPTRSQNADIPVLLPRPENLPSLQSNSDLRPPTRPHQPSHALRYHSVHEAKHPRPPALPLCARVSFSFSRQWSTSRQPRANRRFSDYKDDGTNILLDANENAYGPGLALSNDGALMNGHASHVQIDLSGLNRYPDPYAPDCLAVHL